MLDRGKVERSVRAFVLENYLFTDDESALKSDASFLESEILDSMGILELTEYLHEEFGIEIEDADMVPSNLDSVDRVVSFVLRKARQE